ncbi:MAG: (d)CMP kinase [Myxococcota bacterium]|nr:(d)CMP kinase [Myxococcota bacterium]
MRIAIDGTASAGKGTLAKRLAEKLNYSYIDTGALYRGVALMAKKHGIDWYAADELGVLAESLQFQFRWEESELHIYCEQEDITSQIRTDEISTGASIVSSLAPVRKALLKLQKQLGSKSGTVMDGRDIGTVIIPDAELKIYVDADPIVRAKRRQKQYRAKGRDCTLEEVLADLMERDERDKNRETAPLKRAAEAYLLDTTEQTMEESLAQIMVWISSLRTKT